MKIFFITVFFLTLILLSGNSNAQLQGRLLIDSLITRMSLLKEDTNKVKVIHEISSAYYPINPDTGLLYGKQEVELAEKLNWEKGIGFANNTIGVNYWAKSNYPLALEYYFKALKIGEEFNIKDLSTTSLGNIGTIYFEQSNYEKALEFDLKAIKLFQEMDNQKAVARNLGNVAEVYNKLKNYEKALEYYFKALTMNEALGRKPSKALNEMGIADVYAAQSDYPKALENYFSALQLNRELGSKRAMSDCFSSIGNIYLRMVKKNETHLTGNRDFFLQNAKKYTDSSILLCISIGNFSILVNSYANLSEIEALSGDYKKALETYRLFSVTKDSVFNLDRSKKLTQTAMQYEFDKKEAVAKAEQEKKDADSKRIQNLQFTAIGVSLLIVIFLFWNNREKQKAKTNIEKAYTELKVTQAQLIQSEKMASLGELTAGIAHEIQNPLNFVNNFSEVSIELVDEMNEEMQNGNLEDAKQIAIDLKDNLSKINHHGRRAGDIVKGMLQHSRSSSGVKEPTDINALCDEYLRLAYHGLRAKDKDFNATLITDFDDSIGKINMIPQDMGRVILNLITNAFYVVAEKKKLLGEGYDPIVTVTTKSTVPLPGGPQGVEVRVADNGNGIPPKVLDKIFQPFFTTKPTGQGTGLGLSLSYDIVKAHGGEIKVTTKENEGTEFIIQLPANNA
jgi:two-component system NtrC family sensor kinase